MFPLQCRIAEESSQMGRESKEIGEPNKGLFSSFNQLRKKPSSSIPDCFHETEHDQKSERDSGLTRSDKNLAPGKKRSRSKLSNKTVRWQIKWQEFVR